jgi:hypothetical protein
MAKRRRSYRRVARSVRSGRRGKKVLGFFSGTVGKVLVGAIIGGVTPVITSRLAPNLAVLADDAGDLASTFIAGKYGLIGNMVGKRVLPMLVGQVTGQSSSNNGDSA